MADQDAAGSADYFEAAAATWDDDPAKPERAQNSAELLRARLPLKPGDRVLEIGAGTGSLSINLADAVGSVTLSDPAAAMVERAESNIESAGLAGRFSAVRLDLTEQALPEASYDGVWSQLALHHIADVDLVLRRAHAALVPGGWIAVIELEDDPHGEFHAHHDGFAGHHGFGRESFAERLRAAGFGETSVVDAGSVERELQGSGRRNFAMFLAIGYRP